jgi:hypothetical protein
MSFTTPDLPAVRRLLPGLPLMSLLLVAGCHGHPSSGPANPQDKHGNDALVEPVQKLPASATSPDPPAMNVAAPELQGIEAWINSKPFTLKDLRGKVGVLHFWAFG